MDECKKVVNKRFGSLSLYWSSTERSYGNAYNMNFDFGYMYYGSKVGDSFRVRFSLAFYAPRNPQHLHGRRSREEARAMQARKR